MSYLEIYGVEPGGDVVRIRELQNSWLGAALYWTRLGNKYLGEYDVGAAIEAAVARGESANGVDPMGWERTWALQRDPRITDAEWFVLMSTFDKCVIPRKQFAHAASCFAEVGLEYPQSHFTKLAGLIESAACLAYGGVCFCWTSVSSDGWRVSVGEDESRPYNVDTDPERTAENSSGHWYLNQAQRAGMLAVAPPAEDMGGSDG